ncbi:MAG: sigma-70 family RNA polymerase sigma factor [Phycisphaerales bacterium]|nr:sigma-70 family RNA polymerase sigma factor [Phycisphaerales bacterium]
MNPWIRLWRREHDRLASYARSLTASDADAEDLLSDVMTRLVERRARARDPLAYALRSIRHERARLARRRAVAPPMPRDASDATPDLEDALGRLSEIEREVVMLKARSGITLRRIATVLELPEGTVRSHYTRGLRRLRASLLEEVIDV